MVTNCSKERPSSIVNETLKNGILMLKYTSKESDFHAEKIYEPEKICFILENRGKHPVKGTKHTIAFGVSENPIAKISSSYLQKMWNFVFFARRQITGACLLVFFFFFFFRGHCIDQVVLECRRRAHSNRNKKF